MTADRALPVTFAVTPRFDVFYALYALTHTAPSTLEDWKDRAIARLPRDFERVARRVAPVPLFWPLLADALQRSPGEMTFAINRAMVAEGSAVSDQEVAAAVAFAFRELKLVVEPGGAAALAALLSGKLDVKGKIAVAVLSGGNVDPDLFYRLVA